MTESRTRTVSTRERSLHVDVVRSDDRVFVAMVGGRGSIWEVIADAASPRHVRLARGQDLQKGKIYSAKWNEKQHRFIVSYGTPAEALDALGSVAYAYHQWLLDAEELESEEVEELRASYGHGETMGHVFDRPARRANPTGKRATAKRAKAQKYRLTSTRARRFVTSQNAENGNGNKKWDLWVFVPRKHSTDENWKRIYKAVGRAEVVGSGTDLRTGERDTSWWVKSEASARAAAKRLRALRGVKLRVEIKQVQDYHAPKKLPKNLGKKLRKPIARRHAPTGKRGLRFRHEGGTKFWEITPPLHGNKSFTVTWGKIGTRGQSQTKTFRSSIEAGKAYRKLLTQKSNRGYSLVYK